MAGDAKIAVGYLAVVIAGSLAGYLLSAHLADCLGRKTTLILFAVGSFTTVVGYTYAPIGNHLMLALGFPLGFFASGVLARSARSSPSSSPIARAGQARVSPTVSNGRSAPSSPRSWVTSVRRCLWATLLLSFLCLPMRL